MTTPKTKSRMSQFNRLEEIRGSLNTSKPDLDQMMPIFDETNEIEDELLKHFKNMKDSMNEKQEKRQNNQ
jgi:hypothetical protein